MGVLSEVLLQEMGHTFELVKKAVSRIEPEFVNKDEKDWTFAYVLFHAIESIEFYVCDSSEDWKPLSDVSQNSRQKETETLKTKNKEFFERYVTIVEERTFNVIKSFTDDQLMENDGFGVRGFKSRFHKFSYTMRHTFYHLGELTKYLRSIDKERIRW